MLWIIKIRRAVRAIDGCGTGIPSQANVGRCDRIACGVPNEATGDVGSVAIARVGCIREIVVDRGSIGSRRGQAGNCHGGSEQQVVDLHRHILC